MKTIFSAILLYDISDSKMHPHLADVGNEMHFCLRAKIIPSLCDQSCTSSTKCARGVNPFDNSIFVAIHRGIPSLPAMCATSLSINRLGLQTCGVTQIVVGLVGVKQEWKESICDESEGGEGRLT